MFSVQWEVGGGAGGGHRRRRLRGIMGRGIRRCSFFLMGVWRRSGW